jgi:two-component system sensor kinase FixL
LQLFYASLPEAWAEFIATVESLKISRYEFLLKSCPFTSFLLLITQRSVCRNDFSLSRQDSSHAMARMSSDPSHPITEVAADRFVRRLEGRYVILLAAVALALLLDQALVQPGLASLNSYAPAINIAGRQRMLSQRIAKSALALSLEQSAATRQTTWKELRDSLNIWTAAHDSLFRSESNPQIRELDEPELADEIARLETRFQTIHQAASSLLQETEPKDSTQPFSPAAKTAVNEIQANEGEFLRSMDRLVGLLETASDSAVKRLRYISLAISTGILLSLLAIGNWVLRPATRAIRVQVDDLEQRIGARTQELAATNASLLHEIHDREAAELRSQQLSAQLAHAGRVSTLSHLATGLAHELNQPLAAIVNYAEACRLLGTKPELDRETLQNHLHEVQTSAILASQIVRRMRNFTRPQASDQFPCELHPLIREVASLLRIEMERAEVCLTLKLEAAEPLVQADPIQIQQVLINLIHNASQAMQAVDPMLRQIDIRTQAIADQLQITVADTGPGLTESLKSSLFEPFVTSKTEGLGLGLFICRCIVEQHHGQIHAESTTSGTLLRVTLPLCARGEIDSAASADHLYR